MVVSGWLFFNLFIHFCLFQISHREDVLVYTLIITGERYSDKEMEPTGWEKIFENHISVKRLASRIYKEPWLVWLSGLSSRLLSNGSPVRFPVRVHAWVAGQVPSGRTHEGQPHIDVSLPLFLSSPLPL